MADEVHSNVVNIKALRTYARLMTSNGSINVRRSAIWAKPPPAKIAVADNVIVGSETTPWNDNLRAKANASSARRRT